MEWDPVKDVFSDNDMTLIDTMWEVKRLHQELASLYRTRSRDAQRINTLWREIEKREELLELNGVLVK